MSKGARVHLSEPSWWYEAEPTVAARLLAPLANAYGRAVVGRYQSTKPFVAARPVICVGNFTMGGTGKTPIALALADCVERAGGQPWFLTRGYGGRFNGPHRVNPLDDKSVEVGDEALLLARRAPTIVARDRPAGARTIVQAAAANAVIIMDDGLQNPSLAKDLSFAVVDGARGIGNGAVFPAGPLRAPVDTQIGWVDAIIVNSIGPASLNAGIADRLRRSFPGPVLQSRVVATGDVDWVPGTRLVAFAGIGNPGRFFALLETLGGVIVGRHTFADHQPLRERDAERLLEDARARNAALVTTAKDLARLAGGSGALAQLAASVRTVAISVQFEPQDLERLDSLVLGVTTAASRVTRPPIKPE